MANRSDETKTVRSPKLLHFVFISFFWTLFPGLAFCEKLTLDELESSINRNYPLILGAKQDVEKSEADYLSSNGMFDPVLKASYQDTSQSYYVNSYYDIILEQPTALWGTKVIAGYRKGSGSFPVYDTRYPTFDQGEIRTGLEVPLLKGGLTDERRTRVKLTEAGIRVAKQALESKKFEIKREAGRKYFDWLASGKKLRVAEQLLSIALVREEALETRVKKGDVAQIDFVENQRAVVQRRAAVLAAQRSLQKTAIELSLYYRDEKGTPVIASEQSLPSEFPDYLENLENNNETPTNLDLVTLNHPDSMALTFQLEQVDYDLSQARNQILPKLDFSVLLVKDLGTNPGLPYIPPTNYPSELKLSLGFEFPLFARTARWKLESLSKAQQKLNLIQDLTRDRLKSQIIDSSQAMKAARGRIDFAKQEVALSYKLENGEKTRFKHGDSSLFLVNLREQGTRDAINKEIEALSEYFKAKVDYQTYLGKPQ